MAETLRYADTVTQSRYPLNISQAISWQKTAGTTTTWKCEVAITSLRSGEILVPSFASLPVAHQFQFTLDFGLHTCTLNAVPSIKMQANEGSIVTSQIDYFKVHKNVYSATLTLEVISPTPPEKYLLTISRRLEQAAESLPEPVSILSIPTRSQMQLDHDIRHRTCSPISVAMVLDALGISVDLSALLTNTRDKATGLFGVWPLNIFAAGQQGVIGAVECFKSWQDVCHLLEMRTPVILSIRFGVGELPGSPLQQTAGHLVVLRGISDGKIWVNDPAAASSDAVYIGYDIFNFSRAWLGSRGVAYILI